MSNAALDGKPIPLDEAYQHAANILSGAVFPLVAGLSADIAGARAAILLAERLRGAFDHLASRDSLADLEVARSFGMFVTTPNEARVRSDYILLVGPGLAGYWPELFERLALDKPPRHGAQAGAARKVLWVGPKRGEAKLDGVEVETIAATPQELPGVLGALRARLGGRPISLGDAAAKKLDAHAAKMKAARFGAAVWAAAGLDALTLEMLQGLITDLNVTTRFTGVPIGARAGAAGVVQASAWMTGFPPRTGFGRGHPEHDPWRFEASRLVDSGEADAALWISAYDGEPPPWTRHDIPLVTLAPAGAAQKLGLFIEVGRPGEAHDALEYAAEAATLVVRKASRPALLPSVAEAVQAIGARLADARLADARLAEDIPC
jgi:formylmethanofuran dehydrogenase subunit B